MVVDATFWVAVSFVIFFGGLVYLKVPQKINELLNKMILDIKNEIDESEKLRTEAKTLLDNAQNKLDTAQSVSKEILEQAGWEVEETPATNDQGVDLIACIEDLRVCIQCKCFAKAVGNKAVQEIIAGTKYRNGTHSVVVAKSGFTTLAKQLAESANVILTSDIELAELENRVL